MAVDPKKIVAAIVPDVYCSNRYLKEEERDNKKDVTLRDMVKRIVKESLAKGEKNAYLKAAEKAELVDPEYMDFDLVIKTPFKLEGIKNAIEQHLLTYESSTQSVEQVYFWLHDYLYNKAEYGSAEKLSDNFISSPGSAHFSEMGMKATKMQEEAGKLLGGINQIIKVILNIIYDLKEFKLRLAIYDDYNNKKDKAKSEAAFLSLKQVWLDQVDVKRGNTSLKGLAVSGMNQPNFVMVIDGFMVAQSLQHINAMDLNDRVKNLLKQRFSEFERWLGESERELRKRYDIEKIYLKSQLNTIKMYSRWVKPYLKAASRLEQRATETSAFVYAFNTSLFELTLLGIGDYKVNVDVARGELPKVFKESNKRKYTFYVLSELKFRTIPERHERGYGFKGTAEITFTSFALNKDEQKVLKEQLEYDDFKDMLEWAEGSTTQSLDILQKDIDEFLEEKKETKKEEESSETNPFSALFSGITDLFKSEKTEEKKKEEKKAGVAPDSKMDEIMRSQAGIEGRRRCRKFYDSFKKANESPAFQS
jgi:hypothetical protein